MNLDNLKNSELLEEFGLAVYGLGELDSDKSIAELNEQYYERVIRLEEFRNAILDRMDCNYD